MFDTYAVARNEQTERHGDRLADWRLASTLPSEHGPSERTVRRFFGLECEVSDARTNRRP